MSAAGNKRVRRRGTAVATDTTITSVASSNGGTGCVETSAPSTKTADATLWGTGTVGPPLSHDRPFPTDDRGFLRVRSWLQAISHPRIFAAGDCASSEDLDPARVGVHLVKHGSTLRANPNRVLATRSTGHDIPPASDREPFSPDRLTPFILSTGTADGLWTAGSMWTAHPWLLLLKHGIDRRWIGRYDPEEWGTASWRDLLGAESARQATAS